HDFTELSHYGVNFGGSVGEYRWRPHNRVEGAVGQHFSEIHDFVTNVLPWMHAARCFDGAGINVDRHNLARERREKNIRVVPGAAAKLQESTTRFDRETAESGSLDPPGTLHCRHQ